MTITQTNPRNYAPSVRAIEDMWADQAATAGTYPFLAGIALEDLHDHFLHSASAEEKDRILYALLSESAAGDDLATLTVVRLFIAKAVRLARSCTALRSLPHTEAVSCSIAAFWEAARAYPLHRKSKTAANLYLNAMEIIDRQRVAGAEVFLAQDALDWAVERSSPHRIQRRPRSGRSSHVGIGNRSTQPRRSSTHEPLLPGPKPTIPAHTRHRTRPVQIRLPETRQPHQTQAHRRRSPARTKRRHLVKRKHPTNTHEGRPTEPAFCTLGVKCIFNTAQHPLA